MDTLDLYPGEVWETAAIGLCPICGEKIYPVDGVTCISDHCNPCKMERE
jgi:hypothetical protein